MDQTIIIIGAVALLFAGIIYKIVTTALEQNAKTIENLLQDNRSLRGDLVALVANKEKIVLPSEAKQFEDMANTKPILQDVMPLTEALERGLLEGLEQVPKVKSTTLTQ